MRRAIEFENRRWPTELVEMPRSDWPTDAPPKLIAAWRSRTLLVQVYAEPGRIVRLSVCRAALTADGGYQDGLSWDELQRAKAAVGYGDRDAVEIYPPDVDVVNVASMRHLWVLPIGVPLPFAWRRERD
jgi:hypothetical protein